MDRRRKGGGLLTVLDKSRGQAMVETAIALPVFLIAFFGLLWAMRSQVIAERTLLATRSSAFVQQRTDPYTAFSLNTVYNNLGTNVLVTPSPCSTPNLTTLSDTSTLAARASSAYFQAYTAIAKCNSDGNTPVFAYVGNEGNNPRSTIFRRSMESIVTTLQATTRAPIAGTTTTSTSHLNRISGIDLGGLIHCLPEVNSAMTASLGGATDTTTPATLVTPFPDDNAGLSAKPPQVDVSCTPVTQAMMNTGNFGDGGRSQIYEPYK